MDLNTVKIGAEYGSAGLYAFGLLCFFVYALVSLRESLRHFFVTTLVGVVWPIFMVIILLRANKKRNLNRKSQ